MSVRILHGDCREVLKTLDADSVDCVVTSPPYWGLRDYGVAGQLGLEPSLGEHIETMVDVFREVRRVLKPTGTFWLNYGDCYATSPNGRSAADTKATGNDDRTFRDKPLSTVGPINRGRRGDSARWGGGNNSDATLKAKDLCMVPNRIAIALQEDGWWVRSEIIWGKPNPMPESIKDRPGTAHEKIFMLSKNARYFYDYEAVRVPRKTPVDTKMPDGWDTGQGAHGSVHRLGREKGAKTDKQRGHSRKHAGFNARWDAMSKDEQQANGRGLRNYEPAPLELWHIAPKPFKEAHFATFPPELAERCIKAGCPVGGVVLDPFFGAGTVGLVAEKLGRECIGIELNPGYIDIAEKRIGVADMLA